MIRDWGKKIIRWLWGDLTPEEFEKFGLLAITFLFIIGSYWLLRPLKDGIFDKIVGLEGYQPIAKIVSLCVLVPLIMLYSKLVDIFEKHKLFYILGSVYAILFAILGYFLADPKIGLPNPVASPDRYIGWFSYVLIESFGSIMVALFWSFVTSSTESSSAKKGFPLIIFGAQLGSIAGPTLVKNYVKSWGIPPFFGIVVGSICLMMLLVYVYMRVIPHELTGEDEDVSKEKKPKTGMIEGIKLIVTRPYVLGIFGIATFYEIIGTIIDYQLKVIASNTYPTAEELSEFFAFFGQCVNGLALAFALLGTSFFMRRFGLTFCLLLFPITVGFVVAYVYALPVLWVIFFGVVAIKGLSYALNNPAKEMMYIPTSKDVRFKSKGWIDMFGNRSAKAAGAAINNALKGMPNYMQIGTAISLGIVGIWIAVATYVGRTFHKLTHEGKVIE